MERAARLIARMKIPGGPGPEELLRAVWPAAVGKVIARRTQVKRLAGSTLWVEVEDESWLRQLVPLEGQILKNLRELVGAQGVERIVFRVCLPRRGPGRAGTAQGGDEADGIADPVLRRLYLKQRSRSMA